MAFRTMTAHTTTRLALSFDIARDISSTMEELGYDILWMAEHHFQREGYETIPNLLMLSVWLSQFTQRLKFGCGFNILPMWHPLRLAEDFAMADILTQGRVIFGVGRGYHTREVETFGAPMRDADANRELFEEQFEIIMKAFNEQAFTHKGSTIPCPPKCRTAGTSSRISPWCPGPSIARSTRGSRWSAALSGAWILWPGTASKASCWGQRSSISAIGCVGFRRPTRAMDGSCDWARIWRWACGVT